MSETDRVGEKYGDLSKILYFPTIKDINCLAGNCPDDASELYFRYFKVRSARTVE